MDTWQAVVETLRAAPQRGLPSAELKRGVTESLEARLDPSCKRPECEPLDRPPGGVALHRMFVELERRGDIRYTDRQRIVLAGEAPS